MESLTTRVALAGGFVATVLVAAVGSMSFVALSNQIKENIQTATRFSAEIEARQLAGSINGIASHQLSTARNSLIANALTDAMGRDAYVKPFLVDLHEVNGVPLTVTMTDHGGRSLATTLAGEQQASIVELARRAIHDGHQVGGLVEQAAGRPHLVFATPIIYANTGTFEGALVYELDLPDPSPLRGTGDLLSSFEIGIDRQPAAAPSRWGRVVVSEPLPGGLWLTVAAEADETRLSRPLTRLLWNTAWIGAICLALTVVGSRVIAKVVTRRLRQLEFDATRVVEAGSFSDRFVVTGGDEVSRLAKSFNAVLDRLETAHKDIARQGELRLRDSEARYRLLAEYASDVIARIGADGVIRYVSPAVIRTYGHQPADMAGSRVVDYVHPEDRRAVVEGLELAGRGEVKELIFRLRGADGTWNWVEASAHVVPNGDSDAGLVAILRDIRKRRMVEAALADKTHELERSNAELEQFAYVASHDLREPLRMVTSYLQLIARKLGSGADEETACFLAFATDGAKRMDRLILDMLEFSRVGRNRRPDETTRLDEVLAAAASSFLSASPDAVVLPATDAEVVGDRQELARLFQNLIGNGIKYRPADRPPRIVVTVAADAGEVVVSVADNGIGIAQEHFERIFQIFQRLHGREEFEGTGIGLAICKKIVDRHRGRIWLDSVPGQGTTFHVALPA
ncbi:MAG TPA: ATP-binding protein, partial [Candidatus Omnitrophota bacterium]|nr:ATP-binding protein [Candidatus Omnitrophota bacterium]